MAALSTDWLVEPVWHGFDDPGPSPLATIEYYKKVEQSAGAEASADLRFYFAPRYVSPPRRPGGRYLRLARGDR